VPVVKIGDDIVKLDKTQFYITNSYINLYLKFENTKYTRDYEDNVYCEMVVTIYVQKWIGSWVDLTQSEPFTLSYSQSDWYGGGVTITLPTENYTGEALRLYLSGTTEFKNREKLPFTCDNGPSENYLLDYFQYNLQFFYNATNITNVVGN
jgi:hypothetical protein